ncbi:MAG: hypothetical protein GWN79_11640, partial [Actinobacteria bacterium]|nr:hypothetical protein [Actinomycetota bacterium]NIS32026.1 hypothetical protein [Actinomycetota bacterium]NIT96019.1 hypothetical protein [Actinomycetota bacterium]NIU19699.1 hypothetical protein [Actinomycetota bacterium]NIU67095.1 hypothetical protein [Actinomycetota bacterium]
GDDVDELAPTDVGVVPTLASLESRDEEPIDPLDDLSAGDPDDDGDLFAEGGADAADEELDP